ncbi:MAG TPA: hypothetical protein PLZ55_17955, partial [bacterium]|nr:hypothetical protein [bacterium]
MPEARVQPVRQAAVCWLEPESLRGSAQREAVAAVPWQPRVGRLLPEGLPEVEVVEEPLPQWVTVTA